MKTSILKKRNSIIIQFRVEGKQFRIYTGIAVKDSEWNKKSKSIIGDNPKITSLNQLIKSYRDEVELNIYDLRRIGAEYNHELFKKYIKLKLTTKSKVKNNEDVFHAFDLFIMNKKYLYSPLTITAYKNTLSHLKNYYNNKSYILRFDELNKEWFEKFTFYLKTQLKHSPNTRSNQIKNIKAVLNYAYQLDLHDNTKYHSIKKENESSPNIYLSEFEIEQLSNTNFSDIIERQFIDAFIFICLTGLRYSDYIKISKENFKLNENYWYLNFQQTNKN